MLRLQKGSCVSWEEMGLYRRLTKIFENETAFAIGVICLGLFPVAAVLAVLFFR
jgi:hypothetical protein